MALHKTRLRSPPAGRRPTLTTGRENWSPRLLPTSDRDPSSGCPRQSPAELCQVHPRTLCQLSRSGQLASQRMSSALGDRKLQTEGPLAQRSTWKQAASGKAAGEAGAATMRMADERDRGLQRAGSSQRLSGSVRMNGLHFREMLRAIYAARQCKLSRPSQAPAKVLGWATWLHYQGLKAQSRTSAWRQSRFNRIRVAPGA